MSGTAELASHRYLSLATFRVTGAEVRTPVWFAESGGRLYVFTSGESGKVKRLRHSSRARVAPCDARGNVQGAWHDAVARIITDAASIDRARLKMRAKYGWQLRVLDAFSRLMGRINQRAWIEVRI